MPRQVLRQQLAGVFHQPEHRRVAHRHLPLAPRLKHQHEGADQPFELLDGVFHGAIGLRLMGRRGLSNRPEPQ
eukprot:15445677-Alexandrium_andersonii.AAC.1